MREYSCESSLFLAGEKCNGLYILSKGELNIYVKGSNYRFCNKFRLKTGGTIFGEISFFFDTTRTAAVSSAKTSKVFFLQKKYHKFFKEICPTIVRRLLK
jgi:CRP-like cAMP-binding protein